MNICDKIDSFVERLSVLLSCKKEIKTIKGRSFLIFFVLLLVGIFVWFMLSQTYDDMALFTIAYIASLTVIASVIVFVTANDERCIKDLIQQAQNRFFCFAPISIVHLALTIAFLTSTTQTIISVANNGIQNGTGSVDAWSMLKLAIDHPNTTGVIMGSTAFTATTLFIGVGFFMLSVHQYQLRLKYVHKELGIEDSVVASKDRTN